ncbi:MAG: ribosome silencing factor [bacterium]
MSDQISRTEKPDLKQATAMMPRRLQGISSAQDPAVYSAAGRSNPARLTKAFGLACLCAQYAADAKAENILLLDMRKLTSVVDFFIIATVPSRRQATGIAAQVEAEMKKRQEKKLSVETSESGRWTLLDYGDVVVHLFSPEGRGFYSLDEVWGDAPRLDWTKPDQELPN